MNLVLITKFLDKLNNDQLYMHIQVEVVLIHDRGWNYDISLQTRQRTNTQNFACWSYQL